MNRKITKATLDGVLYKLVKGVKQECIGCAAYATTTGTYGSLCGRLPDTCISKNDCIWVKANGDS